jgi:iron complex outermembrane recepter protein
MRRVPVAVLAALAPALAAAQQPETVVITATRVAQPSLEVPASIDRIYGDEIREARPQVNLSESLGRVPGLVVQNRQNYAQDLQISSRGFGARATFGVRGMRLIADGIPATMPDGQGQAATFALGSASRIEVLRGPFSTLYGNAAGGVISIETEDGAQTPTGEASLLGGSYGTWKAGFRFGGTWGALNALGDISRFETDGYRDHSETRRDHLNARLKYALSPDTSLIVVANSLDQPDTQDPLGLTRQQFEDNPRQAVAPAFTFNTRKSVFQDQVGATLNHRFDHRLRIQATVYGGERWVEQYLGFQGSTPNTTSGGVVQLDRGYGGGALRFFTEIGALRVSSGFEYERMEERRRGFENLNGERGALRRDEDDTVSSTDAFAQAEWRFAERWSAHAGVRTGTVKFRSSDYYIVPGVPNNPDDSGSREYKATTPVAGLLFMPSKVMSVYANYGRGFETPTFAELAHQNTGSGLNFALQAARSRHAEVGVKAVALRLARASAALFDVRTRDEIVVDTALNGRTTFKNAGRTERRGAELVAETLLPGPWDLQLAYTVLDAEFAESFTTGTATIPEGNHLPGVPKTQAFVQLRYRQPSWFALVEFMQRSEAPVNDANTEYAPSFRVYNLAAGLAQQGKRWRISEFVRVDNLADRKYAGSVIVNEANGRFYEPAPERNYMLGVQGAYQF